MLQKVSSYACVKVNRTNVRTKYSILYGIMFAKLSLNYKTKLEVQLKQFCLGKKKGHLIQRLKASHFSESEIWKDTCVCVKNWAKIYWNVCSQWDWNFKLCRFHCYSKIWGDLNSDLVNCWYSVDVATLLRWRFWNEQSCIPSICFCQVERS